MKNTSKISSEGLKPSAFDFALKKGQRCLIIAPHPDDETIGMGGFMLQNPKACDVLVLTDGRNGGHEDIRHQEFVTVMQKIGIKNYQQWDIKDATISKHLFRLLKIKFNDYDYVFVPSPYETHRDHRCLHPFLKFWLHFYKSKLVSYEVGVPQLHPNITLDISRVAEAKRAMISEYSSQIVGRTDYTKMLGLNQYRGLRRNFDYAETFRLEDCNLLSKLFSRRQERGGVTWQVLGLRFKSRKRK